MAFSSLPSGVRLLVLLVVVAVVIYIFVAVVLMAMGSPADRAFKWQTKEEVSAFSNNLLEATLAPGAQQRYDTSLSHTGADGNTENQKLNASRARATPVVSGLTGSREAPYFPEGSMYNIEGKRAGAAISAGDNEPFQRSKFDAAKLEENVYG